MTPFESPPSREAVGGSLNLIHVTKERRAESILREGFVDSVRNFASLEVVGVWLSDRPWFNGGCVELDELPNGYAAIAVEVPVELLEKYEVEDLSGDSEYREWCIPAAIVNELPRHRYCEA